MSGYAAPAAAPAPYKPAGYSDNSIVQEGQQIQHGQIGTAIANNLNPLNAVKDIGNMLTPVFNQYNPYATGATYDAVAAGATNPVQQMLQARALGQGGPSAADIALQSGIGRAQNAVMAAAGGSANPALARRNAIVQSAQVARDAAIAGAQQKAQEEQAAQTAYLNPYVQQQGLNATAMNQANKEAADISQQNTQAQTQANGGLFSAAGGILGSLFKSDRRAKTDVKSGAASMDEFLSAIHPARYEYIDPADGNGDQFGVMAQDLVKSEAGRSFVAETPHGLMVDATRAVGPMLAALSHLKRKVDRVSA